eukprot:TRINITY_DN313_c0_g1_i9.p1 TRINITY_DN313_c0_g1~~TRINITY_DN313_c0_g1_i9.p1  ORF type:complete len:1402 (+),score=560.63 TRINITY_DN313_c0_g1_i9:520-4725(+)
MKLESTQFQDLLKKGENAADAIADTTDDTPLWKAARNTLRGAADHDDGEWLYNLDALEKEYAARVKDRHALQDMKKQGQVDMGPIHQKEREALMDRFVRGAEDLCDEYADGLDKIQRTAEREFGEFLAKAPNTAAEKDEIKKDFKRKVGNRIREAKRTAARAHWGSAGMGKTMVRASNAFFAAATAADKLAEKNAAEMAEATWMTDMHDNLAAVQQRDPFLSECERSNRRATADIADALLRQRRSLADAYERTLNGLLEDYCRDLEEAKQEVSADAAVTAEKMGPRGRQEAELLRKYMDSMQGALAAKAEETCEAARTAAGKTTAHFNAIQSGLKDTRERNAQTAASALSTQLAMQNAATIAAHKANLGQMMDADDVADKATLDEIAAGTTKAPPRLAEMIRARMNLRDKLRETFKTDLDNNAFLAAGSAQKKKMLAGARRGVAQRKPLLEDLAAWAVPEGTPPDLAERLATSQPVQDTTAQLKTAGEVSLHGLDARERAVDEESAALKALAFGLDADNRRAAAELKRLEARGELASADEVRSLEGVRKELAQLLASAMDDKRPTEDVAPNVLRQRVQQERGRENEIIDRMMNSPGAGFTPDMIGKLQARRAENVAALATAKELGVVPKRPHAHAKSRRRFEGSEASSDMLSRSELSPKRQVAFDLVGMLKDHQAADSSVMADTSRPAAERATSAARVASRTAIMPILEEQLSRHAYMAIADRDERSNNARDVVPDLIDRKRQELDLLDGLSLQPDLDPGAAKLFAEQKANSKRDLELLEDEFAAVKANNSERAKRLQLVKSLADAANLPLFGPNAEVPDFEDALETEANVAQDASRGKMAPLRLKKQIEERANATSRAMNAFKAARQLAQARDLPEVADMLGTCVDDFEAKRASLDEEKQRRRATAAVNTKMNDAKKQLLQQMEVVWSLQREGAQGTGGSSDAQSAASPAPRSEGSLGAAFGGSSGKTGGLGVLKAASKLKKAGKEATEVAAQQRAALRAKLAELKAVRAALEDDDKDGGGSDDGQEVIDKSRSIFARQRQRSEASLRGLFSNPESQYTLPPPPEDDSKPKGKTKKKKKKKKAAAAAPDPAAAAAKDALAAFAAGLQQQDAPASPEPAPTPSHQPGEEEDDDMYAFGAGVSAGPAVGFGADEDASAAAVPQRRQSLLKWDSDHDDDDDAKGGNQTEEEDPDKRARREQRQRAKQAKLTFADGGDDVEPDSLKAHMERTRMAQSLLLSAEEEEEAEGRARKEAQLEREMQARVRARLEAERQAREAAVAARKPVQDKESASGSGVGSSAGGGAASAAVSEAPSKAASPSKSSAKGGVAGTMKVIAKLKGKKAKKAEDKKKESKKEAKEKKEGKKEAKEAKEGKKSKKTDDGAKEKSKKKKDDGEKKAKKKK